METGERLRGTLLIWDIALAADGGQGGGSVGKGAGIWWTWDETLTSPHQYRTDLRYLSHNHVNCHHCMNHRFLLEFPCSSEFSNMWQHRTETRVQCQQFVSSPL